MTTDLDTRLAAALKDAADTVTATDDAFAAIVVRADASSRRSSPWPKLVGVAAVAVIALIAVGVLRTDDTAPVYAGWTPTSRMATATEMSEITAVCNARSADAGDELPPDAFSVDSHAEVRGRIALVLQRSSDGTRRYTCTAELQGDSWYAFGFGGQDATGNREPRLEGGGGPDNFTSILYGESSVATSVELDVPGLPTATAPVIDGLYAIWWPGDAWANAEHLPTLELRLLDADGSVIDTINW